MSRAAIPKAKTQKQVICDRLTGSNSRQKIEGWVPGRLSLPPTRAHAPDGSRQDEVPALAAE